MIGRLPLISAGLAGLFLIVSVFLAPDLVAERNRSVMVIASVLVAGITSILVLANWRMGLLLFFLWIAFEDLLRKGFGNWIWVYGIKDVIVLASYFSFWLEYRYQNIRLMSSMTVPLLLWVGWGLVQCFNPSLQSLLVPILGVRMSFFYVPMIFLGFALAFEDRWLNRVFLLNLTVGSVIAFLGVLQLAIGPTFLNPSEAENLRLILTRTAPESGAVFFRPNSTFADASRFSQYLFVITYAGAAFLLYLRARTRPRLNLAYPLVCWCLVVAALIASGQRASMVWLALTVPAVLLVGRFGRFERWNIPLVRTAAILVVTFVGLAYIFPKEIGATFQFYSETLTPGARYNELGTRPLILWTDTVRAFWASGLVGHGTGSSSLGLQYLRLLGEDRTFNYFAEGGYAAVLWEWGLVGLILWLSWSILLLNEIRLSVEATLNSPYFWFSTLLGLLLFFFLFPWFLAGIQVYQNYITQAFIWFFIGLLHGLKSRASEEKLRGITA